MSGNIVIVGATSRMAAATAKELGKRGNNLHLIARDADELSRLASDLKVRFNTKITWTQLEACALEDHQNAFADCVTNLGTIDGVVFATGMLGDQAQCERDEQSATDVVETNYVSGVRFLTIAANYLEQRASGFIAVITSVAGDRGRGSNYVYGSSKGALSLFAQGLRARLCKKGVHVVTIKPGFVDTKMTFGKPGMFLVASPDDVGKSIVRAIEAKKDVVYVPAFWQLIMLIIKLIPERIFKRMKL